MPRALSAIAAALTAAAIGVTMMTWAVLDVPEPATAVALMAAAMLILQANATLSKLLNRERRQTHRLPLGNASLAVISAAALTISLDPAPEISIAAYAVGTAMLYVLMWWCLKCVALTIRVDESRPNPMDKAGREPSPAG